MFSWAVLYADLIDEGVGNDDGGEVVYACQFPVYVDKCPSVTHGVVR